MRYFWGMTVLNVITAVSAGMFVKPSITGKAERLYKEVPLQDQMNTRNGAARELRRCLVDSYIFVSPFPQLPEETPEPDPIKVPQITNTMCLFTDGNGKPAEPVVLRYQARQLRKEIKRFHECICSEKVHKHGRPCHFNMIQTGYNISVLHEVLGNDTQSAVGILTSGREEFYCHIRRNFTIVCHIKKDVIAFKESKLHRTLVCLSHSLTYHLCPVGQQPTVPKYPPDTTVVPAGNTAAGGKKKLGVILLILGCLLFMLIGIFTSVCVVHCWRKRRKRRQKKSIVKRPQQQARSNSYADNLNHVYDYLPGEQVPDILQQRPGNPVHSRFGSERSISVNPTLRSVSYSPSVREQGYYEPLTRQDDAPSLPNRPIPKPRWQFSAPEEASSEYLDLIEENITEDQEHPSAGPTYFVLENTADSTSTQQLGVPTDEYVALLEDEQNPKDQHDLVGTGSSAKLDGRDPPVDATKAGIEDATKAGFEDATKAGIEDASKAGIEDASKAGIGDASKAGIGDSVKDIIDDGFEDHDYLVLESSESEVCVLAVKDDQRDDLSGQLDDSTGYPEDDQYETPVPETPSFDLASSFKCKGPTEYLDKRRYKDYERILPKVPEGDKNIGGENTYFVLES